jgi:hypothetical protein
MKDGAPERASPFCPSAQPDMEGSVVFGVIGGTVEEPRVGYLEQPLPVTEETLALADPVKPTEVFRFAAPCAGSACQHFDGSRCRLAQRTVQMLPAVVSRLPACRIRPKCRWWQQEGPAACFRCPLVVTETYNPSELLRLAGDPNSPANSASSHD